MTDQPNEILVAARAATAHQDAAAEAAVARRRRNWQIGQFGLGVGIGSAAVSAAVLFANRDRAPGDR